MRKYSQSRREEKAILAVGILMIAVVLAAELLRQKFIEAETYVPLEEEQQGINTITAKKKTFIIGQNAKLSQKAEVYVSTNSGILERVKLDLSAVDATTLGTYQVVVPLQKERVSFAVEVMENAKPVTQVVHTNFQLVIGSNSTMQGACDYAGITVADASGNDLGVLITG